MAPDAAVLLRVACHVVGERPWPNARPETARFIPPHQDRIGNLLADWERFVNEPSTMPPVLRAALMHYQFETIHPFLDGNGRIGRLLIGFMLVADGVLNAPILPISGYFERNRDAYYDRLQAVRERGEIEEWVQFFCEGVEQQANQAAARIRALVEIRERYRREAIGDRSALSSVIDLIFRNPVVTVGRRSAAGCDPPAGGGAGGASAGSPRKCGLRCRVKTRSAKASREDGKP